MPDPLQLVHPDALHVSVEDDDAFANTFMRLQAEYPDARIWKVRGSKMRTLSAMFTEFGAALQFPYYFGENWSALSDCLTDLDWTRAQDYLVLVADAHLVLDAEPPEAFGTLLTILADAHRAWGAPSSDGQSYSFRTVLQCPPSAERTLWERIAAAGHAQPAS